MRKLLFYIGVISVCGFQSCSKGSGGGGNGGGGNNNPALSVSLSKSTISADGFEEVSITVKDANNNDVTSGSTIRVNNQAYSGNIFYTSSPGSYAIKAIKGGTESTPVTLTASDPGPSPFTQKVLVEDFTGTWCGHCPRVGIQLSNYTPTHQNCIVVGVHNNDPIQYTFEAQLRSVYGVNAFPTVLVNRNFEWQENNAELDNAAVRRAPVGLGFETSVSGTTINVKTKVKFDVSTSTSLKLIVYLVEDGLVYSQVNYGYYGLPNPIPNYVHDGVARVAATDIFGDEIPVNQQTKGNVWERTLSFNTGTYNVAKCRVVAFVVYGSTSTNRKGALNVQSVAVGQNKAFD